MVRRRRCSSSIIDMAAKLEIDVGVPVATPATGDNRITADTLPAGRYATIVYTGPYEGLMQATADLLAWAQNKGIVWDKWAAGSRGEGWRARIEHYLTDPREEPNSAKWQTELAFKLADDQRPIISIAKRARPLWKSAAAPESRRSIWRLAG